MDFEISIYNDYSADGSQIINSVKAAYLYADKVTVYDYVFPENFVFDELMNKMIADKQTYATFKDLLNKYPFIMDKNESMSDKFQHFSDLMNIMPDHEMKSLLSLLNVMAIDTVDSKSQEVRAKRCESDDYRSEEHYLNVLQSLGVEIIRPNTDLLTEPLGMSQLIADLNKKRSMDHAYKLTNSFTNAKLDDAKYTVPAHIANNFISRLPSFDKAGIDEIKDIRKELNKYIIPFRSEILKMSDEIQTFPSTESDLIRECGYLYQKHVADKVLEIENAIRDNNMIKNIIKTTASDDKVWLGMGTLAISFISSLLLNEALSAVTAALYGGYLVTKGISSAIENNKAIRKNEMFFLYQAERELKKKTK